MTGGASCTATSPCIRRASGLCSNCGRRFRLARFRGFLIFDRDEVLAAVRSLGIEATQTSFESPWQNGVAERWIESCRRELLDHVIAVSERQLKRLLFEYVSYHHEDHTHLGLGKRTADGQTSGAGGKCRISLRSFDLSARDFSWIIRRQLERNTVWDGQLDLRPGGCAARDSEEPSDSRGPLSHASQAPVSLTPRVENLWLDSATVVANRYEQVTVGGIFKLKLDALGSGMTKCVDQGLSPNSVNLLPNRRSERLLRTGDTDTKVHIGLDRKFPLNRGQSQNQIQGARFGRTETLNRVPALLY